MPFLLPLFGWPSTTLTVALVSACGVVVAWFSTHSTLRQSAAENEKNRAAERTARAQDRRYDNIRWAAEMLSSDDDRRVSAGSTVLKGFNGKALDEDEALIVEALLSQTTGGVTERTYTEGAQYEYEDPSVISDTDCDPEVSAGGGERDDHDEAASREQ